MIALLEHNKPVYEQVKKTLENTNKVLIQTATGASGIIMTSQAKAA